MIVKEFAGADNVVFGDVNLQEASVRDPKYGAGAGGWPTIRYFNTETGYDGKPYDKKTSKSMCDELGGDGEYLRAYVNEKGVPPCKVKDQANCSEKEKTFISKFAAQDKAVLLLETERLTKILTGKLATDIKRFVQQRLAILAQLVATAGAGASEEL